MLYLCATPIGNLEDVTLRVLATLSAVDVVLCEDTRHSQALFRRHGIVPRALMSFHEHNEAARLDRVLALLREGREVALVSDAGLPGLSDPGFTLVRACVEAGEEVAVLPGPSAVTTALVSSGLPTDRFSFLGFLPKGGAKVVKSLEQAGRAGGSLVAFESPHRLRATLRAVAERWPSRRLAVCRELTKLHEQVVRGTAAEVLEGLDERVRGEVVLVFEAEDASGSAGPGADTDRTGAPVDESAAREALRLLLDRGFRTKEAASLVARLAGIDGRRAYALALEEKEGGPR